MCDSCAGRLWGNIFVGFFQMTYLVGITIAHTVNAGQALKYDPSYSAHVS